MEMSSKIRLQPSPVPEKFRPAEHAASIDALDLQVVRPWQYGGEARVCEEQPPGRPEKLSGGVQVRERDKL